MNQRELYRARGDEIAPNDLIYERLTAPFDDSEIITDRVGPVMSTYIRRESYERRLEQVLGFENFEYEYYENFGLMWCRLTITLPDKSKVTRHGVGREGKMPNDDDKIITKITSAYKNACERFGIARDLREVTRQNNLRSNQNRSNPQPPPRQSTPPTPPKPQPAVAAPKANKTDYYPSAKQAQVPAEHVDDRVNPITKGEKPTTDELNQTRLAFQQKFAGHAHNVMIQLAYQSKKDGLAPFLGPIIEADEALDICAMARVFYRKWFLRSLAPFQDAAAKNELSKYLESLD